MGSTWTFYYTLILGRLLGVDLELLINVLSWRNSKCWDNHSMEKAVLLWRRYTRTLLNNFLFGKEGYSGKNFGEHKDSWQSQQQLRNPRPQLNLKEWWMERPHTTRFKNEQPLSTLQTNIWNTREPSRQRRADKSCLRQLKSLGTPWGFSMEKCCRGLDIYHCSQKPFFPALSCVVQVWSGLCRIFLPSALFNQMQTKKKRKRIHPSIQDRRFQPVVKVQQWMGHQGRWHRAH